MYNVIYATFFNQRGLSYVRLTEQVNLNIRTVNVTF